MMGFEEKDPVESARPRSRGRAVLALGSQFSRKPDGIVSAPGRVNLIGEHVDYNGGLVLPFAIGSTVSVAYARSDSARVRVWSEQAAQCFQLDWEPLQQNSPRLGKGWEVYVEGVLRKWLELGLPPVGLDAAVSSDLPAGAGLSSSAAFCVALLMTLESLADESLDLLRAARLCQAVEHEFAGVRCGLMDQLTVLAARRDHLLQIDFDALEPGSFSPAPSLPSKDAAQSKRAAEPAHYQRCVRWPGADVHCLLIDSGVRHRLAESEYGRRRSECESAARKLGLHTLRTADGTLLDASRGILTETEFRRARHVVTEIERTQHAVKACESGEVLHLGRLLFESHASLRDDFEVSCAELDLLVDLAQQLPGIVGARLTGGGFGGSIIALVQSPSKPAQSPEKDLQASRPLESSPGTMGNPSGFIPADAGSPAAFGLARVWEAAISRIITVYHQQTGYRATARWCRPESGARELARRYRELDSANLEDNLS